MNQAADEVVACDDLKIHFPIKAGVIRRTVGHVKAVDGVTLSIREGQTVGVVGESGSGKTTLALALLRLISSDGPIAFEDRPIQGLTFRRMRPLRRRMQIVFQDPFGSLSPRMTVRQIIEEGLKVHRLGGEGGDEGDDPRERGAGGGGARARDAGPATRTSSRAASASASPSPARWC